MILGQSHIPKGKTCRFAFRTPKITTLCAWQHGLLGPGVDVTALVTCYAYLTPLLLLP